MLPIEYSEYELDTTAEVVAELTERRNIVERELADLEYRYNQLKLERDDARFFAEDATKELREFKEYLQQRFPNGVVNA